MKDNTKELGEFLETYIDIRPISFVREDSHVFASRISTFFSSLFFPHTEDYFLDGLKTKALHCLFNIVIDDIIEYTNKGEDNVFDSLQVVTGYRNGMKFNGKTESGQIMHDFIHRFYNLFSGPNRKIAEELLFLDIVRILNGFDYERITQNNVLKADREYKEQLCACITSPLMSDIEVKGREYLDKSVECLERICEIDMSGITRAFTSLFENYPGQRTFSPPS